MVTVDNSTTCFNGLSTDEKPIGGRNGDMFYEIDTGALYAYDEQNQTWVQQASGGSGGGGGSDEPTTTVIYEGELELTKAAAPENEGGLYLFIGDFTPNATPNRSPITIEYNGESYTTGEGDGLYWDYLDDGYAITVFDDMANNNTYQLLIREDYMPSADTTQTLSVKITQTASGGGGGSDSGDSSDFSTATVTITNTASGTFWDFSGVVINQNEMISQYSGADAAEAITVVLYNGSQLVYISADSITSTSGDITGTMLDGFTITGDCSVTLEGYVVVDG